MRKPAFFLREVSFCLLLLAICRAGTATTSVIRTNTKEPPIFSGVETYAGRMDVLVSEVKPGPLVTVVLLLDGMNAVKLQVVEKVLLPFYGSLNGRPIRVALLRNGVLEQAGPFATRARLKAALDMIAPSEETSSSPTAAKLFDAIAANAGQWGTNWSRVLLLGDFPGLDAATKVYAAAILVRAFTGQHVRVSWFSQSPGEESWSKVFHATGGEVFHGDLTEYSHRLGETGQTLYQLDWNLPSPPNGFVIAQSRITDVSGQATLETPDIAVSEGTPLPTIEQYAAAQARISEAAGLLDLGPLSEANAERVREALRAALQLNPREPAALLTASLYNERRKDYAAAARFRSTLTEVRPLESSSYADLGHVLTLAGEFEKAELALRHAIELDVLTLPIAEDLAQICLARNDDKGALPYLEEALKGDQSRQDLWFLKARAAEHTGDAPLATQSFERGLALGGIHVHESEALLHLYLGAKQDDKAKAYAQTITAGLPSDPVVREEFAAVFDGLNQSVAALSAWKRVLEVQPGSGRAHYRIASLLLESGDPRAAQQAAEEGLGVAPKYAGLYFARADALEKQGKMYDARDALEQGGAAVQDVALLSRLAHVLDSYGGKAADAYTHLGELQSNPSPERLATLERGLTVSLRDADFKHAESFASLLEAAGHPEARKLLHVEGAPGGDAVVHGGLDALAFAAHSKEGVPPDKFFLEYSRTLINRFCAGPNCGWHTYVENLQEHFQRMEALEASGKRDGNKIVIPLSVNGKEARRNTEKVLGLIGIKLRSTKGQLEVSRGENKDQAKKQETASALAVDELAIQAALQAGKTYSLEIPDERAAIYPHDTIWRESFALKETAAGGFAGTLLRNPKLAKLYIGLNSLDRQTINTLFSAVSLSMLAERYSDEIYLFAAAFASQGGRAVVPGGVKAEAIWESLVGESPAHAGPFFRALLSHDDGKLLAFIFVMSQLDREHQAFFTANPSRTARFFKMFADSDEMRTGKYLELNESTFTEFFRSVPLDSEGHVDFPGSGEVWTVVKGRSSGKAQTANLMKRVSRAVAPEVEDELLLRLATTRYKEKAARHTELENFLAVARIDAHRAKPMDEQSALTLAQDYAGFESVYPYFTDITSLGAPDYAQFFTALDRIKTHNLLAANVELGELHSLVEWICLLRRREIVTDDEAAKLFRSLGERFATAESAATYTAASLESARAILTFCKAPEKLPTADERIRACLLGPESLLGSKKNADFIRLLELQRVPGLQALFTIYDAAAKHAIRSTSEVAAIDKLAQGLPSVELANTAKITGKEKENILRYDPAPVRKIIGQMAQKAAKSKPNPKDMEKLCDELLAELQSQVSLALSGQVYAYFLRPSDLVISEDALLLRKHRFFNFDSEIGKKQLVVSSNFSPDSKGAGSYFVGGFAQFGLAAGAAAGSGWKTSGPAGEEVIAAQIAAIRGTVWDHLQESDQRLVSLRTTVAREWIVESARRPEAFVALSDETMGLLSLSRRSDVLTGIDSRNWIKVWDAVTLPDLFALGGKYLERFKADLWTSPAISELRLVALSNNGSRLPILGAVTYHSFGCNHPHLMSDAPYEEYERHMFPAEMAERTAEFKLFLVYQADSIGLAPANLERVAEPLAAKAFRNTKMTDEKDWKSLMSGYASIGPNDFRQAMEQ